MKEAKSINHMMDHSKFNPFCRACVEAKAQRKGKRKGALIEQEEIPKEWGLSIPGDHLINKRIQNLTGTYFVGDEEIPCATAAVVLYDRGTKELECFPKATRAEIHTEEAFRQFSGNRPVKSFYCDNAQELSNAARALGWMNPTSTP